MDDPGLSSGEMARLFGPEGRVRAFLEIEAVLAQAQAELGLIPDDAAGAIATACRELEFDVGSFLDRGWEEGSALIPLLDSVRLGLGDHGNHLHWETTTQDIVDTALCWRASQAIGVLIRDLVDTGDHLSRLAAEHRQTWMTGRSFLQAARPITFGSRAALWLSALSGRLHDLEAVRGRLQVQLAGPVGIGSGMAGRSKEVASLMAEHLGLSSGEIPWQSDREPMVALGASVAGVARTSEKVAGDLMVLAQTEVAEVTMRPGGSTSMSHKANPVDAMRAIAAARLAVTAAAGLLVASPPRLERDAGGWQVEWPLVHQTFDGATASVQAVNRAFATLEVDETRMAANLDRSLGGDRPETSAMDHLIDTAIAFFEKTRSDLVSGG